MLRREANAGLGYSRLESYRDGAHCRYFLSLSGADFEERNLRRVTSWESLQISRELHKLLFVAVFVEIDLLLDLFLREASRPLVEVAL